MTSRVKPVCAVVEGRLGYGKSCPRVVIAHGCCRKHQPAKCEWCGDEITDYRPGVLVNRRRWYHKVCDDLLGMIS